MIMRKVSFCPTRLRRVLRRLRRDESAFSAVEFGLVLPLVVTLGLYGLEIAWMRVSFMQTSEIALTVADNASRLGQTDNSSVPPTVDEADVDAVLFGAKQQGKSLNVATKGKIILSSLERDPSSGKQYIHWQRCTGALAKTSIYGNDSTRNGLSGTPLIGVGKTGNEVKATDGQAVMVAEVYLQYTPLFGTMFVKNQVFRQESIFLVRDSRTLDQGNYVSGASGRRTGLKGTKKSICP